MTTEFFDVEPEIIISRRALIDVIRGLNAHDAPRIASTVAESWGDPSLEREMIPLIRKWIHEFRA